MTDPRDTGRDGECPGLEPIDPDEVGLGSKSGLFLARLAFVGDMKLGRVGVRRILSTSANGVGSNSVGVSLRRFGEGVDIANSEVLLR